MPEVHCRFTEFSGLRANYSASYLLNIGGPGSGVPSLLHFQDCQLWNAVVSLAPYSAYPMKVGLTNNLFNRIMLTMEQGYGNTAMPVYAYNNLFKNGASYFGNCTNIMSWAVYDNIFDNDGGVSSAYAVTNGNNAYINSSGRLSPTNANDIILSSFNYTNGPLGGYYQLSTNLYNLGSRSAPAAGLYQYTVRQDQTKEANTQVDIGFHYVAVDANGNPLDADGDGLPDYLEDRNGNGTVEPGETDWQNASDVGLKVRITQPVNGTAQP